MLIKIDIKRAYDSLEWNFVEKTFDLWGFSGEVRKLLMSCLTTVDYNILLNGSKMGKVTPTRGLKQGDPLSPFLFILSAEVFSRMLDKNQDINGIKVCRLASEVSHLFYADDILLATMADTKNAIAIAKCLDHYCRWSGQAPNIEKSSILFFENTIRRTRKAIKKTINFKEMKINIIYLRKFVDLWTEENKGIWKT